MKRILSFLCFCILAQLIVAQEFILSGTVAASDDPFPITGANISIKGSTVGTISNLDGQFQINARKGDILLISFIGYKTQEITVNSNEPLYTTLDSDNLMLDEVVTIGYGSMKKSDLTGAVTSVKADQLQKTPASGLDQALQGRAAGVTVNANSGQPGAAAEVRIRGIGSVVGDSSPIYVVDGMITNDISFLAPSDIQSTEVLKDASATAIYGSRGANGVILVTTKGGSKGKSNITLGVYWGVQSRWNKLNLMNSKSQAETRMRISGTADEIATYQKEGFNEWMSYNTGSSPYFPVIKSASSPNGFDYSSIETDWQDQVFRDALIQNYNFSIDGGNEDGNYAFSTNYFTQEGTIIGSNYERLTLRFNSEFKVRKWLKIGEHLSFMTSMGRNAMNNNSSPGASIISAALAMAPWDPTHYTNGSVNRADKNLSGQIAASSNFKNVTNPFSMVAHSNPKDKTERWVGDIY
ncbi:MAG: SusC/RagA family TonB-linked outer membrane protein, partial [Phocaeicola sp.]